MSQVGSTPAAAEVTTSLLSRWQAHIRRGIGQIRYPDGEHPAGAMMSGTLAGRAGHPGAVASAAVYLASDDAGFVHGTALDVDGGRTGVAVITTPAPPRLLLTEQ